ncbi:histidine kinase [Neptunitalea chrysea]|uniref:Histidine kinase n=1 Tax=Neptunitalea chrysea TaxID=1647581 RepID=A0A9W6EUF7_9FLAO|nr:Hpt domain-containing protein [Neptunitalea chrysea]GLB53435.1 histidine kinase [Neptunitalea chrysea]
METPNFSYINDLSGGDKEFETQLFGILKEELPKEKESYENFIKEKKNEEAGQVVHKLKHKISILGMEKSYVIADTYENNLRKGNTNLKEEFEILLQIITDFLEEN